MYHQRLSRHAWSIAVLLGSITWACSPATEQVVDTAQEIWLFSEEDAAELRVASEDWVILDVPRGDSLGPMITVERPTVIQTPEGPTIETSSPTAFFIRFESNSQGTDVDMSTLSIVAKRERFPRLKRDLTGKLADFLKQNRIEAEAIKVPRGRYLVDISIADTAGVLTVESYRLRVTKKR